MQGVESHGAGSVARNSVANTMTLSQVPNSRRPEIITPVTAAQRPIHNSNKKTIVREGTIVTVKNVGKIRSHNQWLNQAIYHP